jgi:protein-S-isoprenylcysteine O-methyltransferase Ste14
MFYPFDVMPLTWLAILTLWFVWSFSWGAAASWSAAVKTRLGTRTELRHWLILAAGVVLLFGPFYVLQDLARLWDVGALGGWIGFTVVALGFSLCWWARLHLGKLWSASVTRKQDHRIVETGPYAFVRHPIYTGIIIAALATAMVQGSAISLIGAGLWIWSFHIKARMEEGFLRSELGAEAYDSYARRVPMLIPFMPVTG